MVGNKLYNFNDTTLVAKPDLSISFKFKNNKYTKNPHIDHYSRYSYAIMLYLNKPNDCYGGTSIYKSKKINNILPFNNNQFIGKDNYEKLIVNTDNIIKNSNDFWELNYLVKMKYNRLVIYESCLFHSIYLDSFKLFNKKRYTYNLWFISPDEF